MPEFESKTRASRDASPKTDGSPAWDIPIGLWGQFRRHSSRYGMGLVFLGVYQASQYGFNVGLAEAINSGTSGAYRAAIHLGFILMGVSVGAFVVRVLSRVYIFNGGRIAEYELRRSLLLHLHRLGPSFYRRMRTGDIMSRVTNDLGQVRALLGFGVLNLVNTVFGFISALAFMLQISWKLTAASLSTLPILFAVMSYFSKQLYDRQRENQEGIGKLSDRVQASIAGVRVVRSFSLEKNEMASFEIANQDYLEKSLALARLRGALWPIVASIAAFGVVIVFWYGGHLMLAGEIDQGGFLSFYRALAQLSWPLISIGFLVGVLQRGRASYARLSEIFETTPDVTDGTATLPPDYPPSLHVVGLSYAYGETKVLDDVSFSLPASTSLAVVGKTGSGKSTLAALLARLLPTPDGAVFLNGVDICALEVRELRSAIGFAQQDAFLFSTTVGRNVGYVLDDPDGEAGHHIIERAATEAQVAEEVQQLPDGYDTIVGERGVQLSGGQKQRVALARALVSEPPILVLDDPMSAVDARTEQAILSALERERSRRSVILITHRVSAAAECDQILVLDEGRVAECGTHDELLARGGLYAGFAEEQRLEQELSALGAEPALPKPVAQASVEKSGARP
jgi:ATP-binding cassette subfamily B protein